jgi:Tfp pilus assembly protein FimT
MSIFRLCEKESGVTLVELLVMMSVAAILVVALGFSFQGWIGNYKVESEVKQLYTDIMDARTRAMTQNRMHFVQINANNYTVYEDTNDSNTFNPGTGATDDHPIPEFSVSGSFVAQPKTLHYASGWTGTISFNTKGLATSATEIAIPLTFPSGTHPDFDCVDVFQSRVSMGTMSGVYCVYR